MELYEKPTSRRAKHSVLGIVAFVFPILVVCTTLGLTLIYYFSDTVSVAGESLVDQLGLLIPLSLVGLIIGFVALKERHTNKKFVKWGLVACAVPTLALIAEMLFLCCR